jgi:hypothetical protein
MGTNESDSDKHLYRATEHILKEIDRLVRLQYEVENQIFSARDSLLRIVNELKSLDEPKHRVRELEEE